MQRLPQMTSNQVEKLLIKNGFAFIRQKGSHKIFLKEKIAIVVPFHKKNLKKGTLSAILKQAGIR